MDFAMKSRNVVWHVPWVTFRCMMHTTIMSMRTR
jgi:hypothetical protein